MIDPVTLFLILLACLIGAPAIVYTWSAIGSVLAWVTAFVIGTVWAVVLIVGIIVGAYYLLVPQGARADYIATGSGGYPFQTGQSMHGADVFVCNHGDGCFKNGVRISGSSGEPLPVSGSVVLTVHGTPDDPVIINIPIKPERHDVKAEVIEHVARLLARMENRDPDQDANCDQPKNGATFVSCNLIPRTPIWQTYRDKAETVLRGIFKP